MDKPYSIASRFPASVVGVLATLMAGLTICVGGAELWDLRMAGFRDGHMTPYELVVQKPFTALAWISIVSSLYFLYLAFTAARPRSATKLAIAILSYLLLVPGAHWGIKYSLQHFTPIDYGQGG